MGGAECRDLDPVVFFPRDGVGVQVAQQICARCDVRLPCLDYALAHRIADGVWGGASERHRRRLLGHRSVPTAPVA